MPDVPGTPRRELWSAKRRLGAPSISVYLTPRVGHSRTASLDVGEFPTASPEPRQHLRCGSQRSRGYPAKKSCRPGNRPINVRKTRCFVLESRRSAGSRSNGMTNEDEHAGRSRPGTLEDDNARNMSSGEALNAVDRFGRLSIQLFRYEWPRDDRRDLPPPTGHETRNRHCCTR